MKKEEAYRDKNAHYVAFVYDGHVFVLKTIKGTANGKTWTNPRYAFCPISSDTEFAVRFTTVEEAIAAANRVLEVLDGRKVTVWMDVENTCMRNLGSELIDIIKAYKGVIEEAGYQFGVYTGLSFYGSYIR